MATKIKYNNDVIASIRAGQSAVLNCLGMKMGSDIIVEEESDNGSATITTGALLVTENGTYDHSYSPDSVTWSADSEYDFALPMDESITLRIKKVTNLTVPDGIQYFNNPAFNMTFRLPDGTEQSVPLSELGMISMDNAGSAYLSDSLNYAVIWIKDATIVNAFIGAEIFESNTVYISDFIWVVSPEESTGVEITLTAPSKRLDAISSVEVDVKPELEDFWVYSNGSYYPDSEYKGFGGIHVNVPGPNLQTKTVTKNGTVKPDSGYAGLRSVTVNVPVPSGYIKPSGYLTITENGYYDVRNYEEVSVETPYIHDYDGSISIQ